jgi:pantothenate kinase
MATGATALEGDFVLALLGTGTAFAAVRDGVVQHLGGAALGGGSFFGIGRRVAPEMSYGDMVEAAARGDRRKVDIMLLDAYPEGIGRLASAEMTAAHVARAGAETGDFLAGLLNLHGESLAQIAASRATIAGIRRVVLAGGFAHGNEALNRSIVAMCALFGVQAAVAPQPGYAGALGAALLVAESRNGSP